MRFSPHSMTSLVLSLSLLTLPACLSLGKSQLEEDADRNFSMGLYERSYYGYGELVQLHPESQDLRRKLQIAKITTWLFKGREALFQSRVEEAERWFNRVLNEIPGHHDAKSWMRCARLKEAELLARKAIRASVVGDQAEARRLTTKVLAIDPEHPDIISLKEDLDAREKVNRERAAAFLNKGLRELQEAMEAQDLSIPIYNLVAAESLSGEAFSHATLLGEIRSRFADQVVGGLALLLEKDHYAKVYYQAQYAAKVFPDHPELKKIIKSAEVELNANRLKDEAEDRLIRGDLQGAEAKLKEAAKISQARSGLFMAGLEEVREACLDREYEDALNLEAKGSFHQALARLKAIFKKAPDFKDVGPRADDLEDSLKVVDKILPQVKKALLKGDKDRAISLLREIFSFFPWHSEALNIKKDLKDLPKENK